MKKHILYNGIKWYSHPSGYYNNNSMNPTKLHIRIWIDANGPVPKGCVIHHKDEIKTHNDLDNLQCMTKAEHSRLHQLGKVVSEVTISKLSKANFKPITCEETKEVFKSVNAAAKAKGITSSVISNSLSGRYKTAGGYHWQYYREEL